MLEEELHYLLMRAFHASNREVVARVRQNGLLPGQPKILEYLDEHGSCTQKQLGEGCALDKSSITGLLTRMDQQGLVRKQTADDDRRVSLVCLTEEGRRQAAHVRQGFAAVDAQAWKGIPREERVVFLRVMQNIITNLQNKGGNDGKK